MHNTYRNFILARIQAAVGAARAARGITHRGLKGEIREILIRDLFRPLLPSDIGVGTGEIISHTNQTSSQMDIVLYDRSILPSIMFQDASGLIPIESVLLTIEVKSQLTDTTLQEAHDAAARLIDFSYISDSAIKAISAVLALDTDLSPKGMSETERYDKMRIGADPQLRSLCVVGRGCWFWFGDHWQTWATDCEFGEVISFIGSAMNAYRGVAASRGEPKLGRYLIDS